MSDDRANGAAPEQAPPGAAPGAAAPIAGGSSADASDEFFWPPPPPDDPWKHRRGEPRLFALFWLIWLGTAASMSLAPLRMGGLADAEAARPACRQLMLMVIFGVVVLWPMVRLCQLPPRRPVGAVLVDMVVLLVPSLMLILPTALLGWWPPSVVLAAAAMIVAWTFLLGGVLALALGHEARVATSPQAAPGRAGRLALWMGICVLLVAAGPALTLVAAPGELSASSESDVSYWLVASPLTAVQEITRDRFWTGGPARVADGHWRAILLTAVVGVAPWLGGLFTRARGGSGGRRLHSPEAPDEPGRPPRGPAGAGASKAER